MRTSGPCRPSGRSPVSTSSAGSRDCVGQQPAYVVGHRLGHRRGQLGVGTGQRLVHEHHVGVAAVAELVAAVAPHRDDRHPGRHRLAPRLLDRPDHRGQGRLEGGAGDVGQRVADLGDTERHAQVGDADPQQLAAADRTDRGDGLLGVVAPLGGRQSSRSARRRGSAARGAPARRGWPRPAARAAAGRWRSGWSPAPAPSAGRPRPRRAGGGGTTASTPGPRRSGGSRTGPASGSGASANHSSITGSSVRWIWAVRVTPAVSASRWRSAAFGSR